MKKAILIHHVEEMKEKMLKLKKLRNIVNEDNMTIKEYIKKMTVANVRINFRRRTNMLDLVYNMKGNNVDLR